VSDVTRILQAAQEGDPKAAGELLPLVYDELRRLAAHKMANEAPGHTLQATALVHEAWLRLVGGERNSQFQNRAHFFAAPAEDDQLPAVNEALDELALGHQAEAELVKLRYFVGRTNDEAAEALGISPRTAKYYWTHARAWLFRKTRSGEE
jgi:DNA-directed RNA polymerase specialized sigma24 family protein